MPTLYVERGLSRQECELKIFKEFPTKPFLIARERNIKVGGFMGLFTKDGVEVEWYFLPTKYQGAAAPKLDVTAKLGETEKPANTLEAEKAKLIAAAGKDPVQVIQTVAKENAQQQQIIEELRALKDTIASSGTKKEEHPGLVRIINLLKLNEFSEEYITKMIDRARSELPLEVLEDFDVLQEKLVEWIGESIKIYAEPPQQLHLDTSVRRAKIIALVGPTGVGKTTTIAKLAAIYGLGTDDDSTPLDVRMITIDAFRIGAKAQIEKYGDIMGIPVSYVDDKRELKKEISLYQNDVDLILIDTIGKSPKDSAKLGEVKELLDAAGTRTQIHLVMSAGTKASDMKVILQQFEPFNYQSVVLSKLDETTHLGNIISALAEKGKPISYIADGQKVPEDLKKASVVHFLLNLDEFKIDRNKIEERFPHEEADQFKWG